MDQTSATTPAAAPAQPDEASQPTDATTSPTSADSRSVGFGARGRVRRRARFLRKARELAYRDLGGLVYSLHRFGQRNDSLVLAKLATLTRIDAELRGLEASLSERHPVTVLREAGITACPRCAAIHSGEDRFCPNCGLPMSRNVDLPIAGVPASNTAAPPPAPAPSPAPTPAAHPQPSSAATASFAPVPAVPSPVSPATAGAAPAAVAQPASPSPAQAAAATQTHPVTPPPGGRAPVPPVPAKTPSPAQASDDDQPTEIIRPPAPGS